MQDTTKNPAENAENAPRPAKKKRASGYITAKTRTALALMETGIPAAAAYVMSRQTPNRIPAKSSVCEFTRKMKSWDIRHERNVKKASKTIVEYATGKPVGGVAPNSATILQAATRVLDQTLPVVKRTESLNLNATIEPVTLADYLVQR